MQVTVTIACLFSCIEYCFPGSAVLIIVTQIPSLTHRLIRLAWPAFHFLRCASIFMMRRQMAIGNVTARIFRIPRTANGF